MTKTLRECFESHRGHLIGKIDHFFDVYEPHFTRFINTPVKILEIGVDQGGSLELWQQYFGPAASIHGIDINPECKNLETQGFTIHLGSQADEGFLRTVNDAYGPFDIVIDDGSHLMEHQILSFETLYPLVDKNGIYICEDAFTSYWKEYGKRDLNR